MKQLNILILTDIHYIGRADHVCAIEDRKANLGLELVERVLNSVDIGDIDLILLLGDLVDNGNATGAKEDMEALYTVLKATGKPVIVAPGNHDPNPQVVLDIFNDHEGLHDIDGYQIISFVDEYNEWDEADRCMSKMERVLSQVDANMPVIVLQHNPIYPHIDSTYPYNLKNADDIIKFYKDKGVLLSISGHVHWGISTRLRDDVGYLTCPALCERPYRYTILSLNGKEYDVKEYKLVLDEYGLSDLHIHTGYAYCSKNMDIEQTINRMEEFGIRKIGFTDHAGQLYVSGEDYWSGRFVNEPDIIQKNKNTPLNRMDKYRQEMDKYRSDKVLVGLEVEVDCNGNLTLLEEDLHGWDILIGAVHYLPKRFEIKPKEGFMWANECLLSKGVHILAHPFRYFIRNKLEIPKDLYKPLAELLAYYKVAVELNYHTNDNDAEFFAICIENNVPISLGSDAHSLYEVGLFSRHLSLLEQIYPMDRISEILY